MVELARHLARDDPAERVPGQEVGTGGLKAPHGIEVLGRQLFDRRPRRCGLPGLPIEWARLEAVERLVGAELAGEAVVAEDLSPERMDAEERRSRPEGLDRHQRRPGDSALLLERLDGETLPAFPAVPD